jgi:hypothetical protein
MNIRKHDAIHTVFETQHPIEQIKTIMNIASLIITEEFRELILELLKIKPQDAYIREAFRNKQAFDNLITR